MKLLLTFAILFFTQLGFSKNGMYPTKFKVSPWVSNNLSSKDLRYYGGPVISNARVVTVIWGENVNHEIQRDIGGFYSAIVNSTQMDWLDQYSTFLKAVDGRDGTNQHIGRGTYLGEYIIKPQHSSKNLTDEDIQAELNLQIKSNKLPIPDGSTLYMIHFPAEVSITIEGAKSCQAFCAYHQGIKTKDFGDIFYGVMPDYSSGMCEMSCDMMRNVFNTTTAISSHELIEAVTDPFPTPGNDPAYPQAWNTTQGYEIADLCPLGARLESKQRTYFISEEWDNKTSSCYKEPHASAQ